MNYLENVIIPVNVSFVVPAFNESALIKGCLSAIERECAACSIEAEIVVVDNGSHDQTAAIARQSGATVYTIERDSVSAARNFGVARVSHTVIAFIDADVVITRPWAETYRNNWQRLSQSDDILTGHQYAIRPDRSWIEAHWFANLHDRYLAGGNLLINRPLFEKLGGFDTTLKTGEDYDLCERAVAAGANYYEEVGFEAIHLGFPRTLTHFARREVWHGEGDYQSLNRFLRSPVAMIAIFYLALHAMILVGLLTGHFRLSGVALGVLLLVNLALNVLRFRHSSPSSIAPNFVLNYVYFCARAASFFTALWKRRKNY